MCRASIPVEILHASNRGYDKAKSDWKNMEYAAPIQFNVPLRLVAGPFPFQNSRGMLSGALVRLN